ncbi:MAG: DUF362 domain-containing protein [Candidatus Aminicenantes bacterium]|nr:DUF362 domain-containing protein [Candidatus Aminicenantes bacterium]
MADRFALQRRDFLKRMGGAIGAAALGGKALLTPLRADAAEPGRPDDPYGQIHFPINRLGQAAPQARVSLVKGEGRYQIVTRSLELIKDEILGSIGNKKVLIKPNIVLADCAACVTHVDAIRAVLDFISPVVKSQILIAESSFHNTMEGFRYNNYQRLEKEYNARLFDLNTDGFQNRYVLGLDNKPSRIRIVNSLLDPDLYVISVARMKTHNYVFVTLSIKNVIMASPLNDYKVNDKGLMHQAAPARNDLLHYNMFHIGQEVFPDLAIIDGYVGIEGNGPAWGAPIASRVALASLDAVAADVTGTRVMGFDPRIVNYLNVMAEAGMGQGNPDKIELLGTPLEKCIMKYKPNEKMAELYKL